VAFQRARPFFLRPRTVVLALLLGALAAQHAATGTAVPSSGPSVLLITLDTVRADRMGFLGSGRGLTPALDALARGSVVFTLAYAQAPITTASHATILTGTFPPFHRVNDFGAPLPASAPYLPDLFHKSGYRTAAFVGSLILDPRSGTAPGFDRGFDSYDAGFRLRRPGEDRYQTVERRGEEVTARALRWIGAAGPGPWFAWVHLYDAHDPYDPPGDLKQRFAATPYDGEIAAVDPLVGRLAQAAGRAAIVAVAADHGEALGDHGEETHGLFLYDGALHVPLVVRLPQGRSAGVRVASRVRLADLAPTLLEAAGLRVPPVMQGESLLKLLPGPDGSGLPRVAPDRPAYAESDYPNQAFGWSRLVAWRADRFLYVRAPRPELYDIAADPEATHNLADRRAQVVAGMERELDLFVRRSAGEALGDKGRTTGGKTGENAGGEADAPSRRIDPDLARRLAALGYTSGSGGTGSAGSPAASGTRGSPGNPGHSGNIDPKDRVAIANALHDAVLAVEDGAFQKAIPLLERVTASDPGIRIAELQLGVARARQRQYSRAVGPLRQAVALLPEDMFAHYELAVALYETGELKTAAGHFEIVASRMPDWADARYSLGSVYVRIDRVADATRELRAALALDPRHFRANLLLGRILTLQGDAQSALPLLRTAVAVQPSNAEARDFLADALARAGK
jgi:arylsulfatase A-like enzyme/Flp pilus assembly protein TadD